MVVKTASGFEWNVNERIKKDYRMVKAVALVESGEDGKVIKGYHDLAVLMLGEKGEVALENHVMDDEGIVEMAKMNAELTEIIEMMKNQDAEIKK